MKIVYSFNKRGYEARYWESEIRSASAGGIQFIPFNHDPYLDVALYERAQLLDNLYWREDPRLMAMYADVEALLARERPDALIVDNCFPYHPEFLRRLDVYKVLRTTDGPVTAYDRDLAYLHAYDHVLYHSPAYSRDLTMPQKLDYCGARAHDFLPLGLFDAAYDPLRDADSLFSLDRDIDVVFVGAQYPDKMPLLAAMKRAFGRRFVLRGLSNWKRNLYFNVVHRAHAWVSPIAFDRYVGLYERSKIGINIHNRGKYTLGSYRLFDLPANGVMQISDGDEYLEHFFAPGSEIVSYHGADDLIDKVRYYLAHDDERLRIARAGYERVLRDYRFGALARRAAGLIDDALRARRSSREITAERVWHRTAV